MSTITRTPTGKWRAQLYRNGIRRSRNFITKDLAKAWADRTEFELQAGETQVGTGRWHDLLDRWVREIVPKRNGGKTEAKRIERLKREIPDMPLRKLTTPVLAEWRDARAAKVAPASVRRDMALVRAVLEQARREWKLIDRNPLVDVKRPPAPPPRTRLITQEEVDKIVHALGFREGLPVVTKKAEVAVMFLVAIETGMRASELLACKVDGKVARLSATKNGDAREVPLTKRAQELLGRVPAGFTVSNQSRDALFRAARQEAKLSGFTFHDSRALALTRLARKVDVVTLARIIGHRDPRSLMIYYRESAADIADRLG